jgi:hypothetical protein
MAASRTEKGSSSRKVKGEGETALSQDALLCEIKSYLIACKTPADDWQLIKDCVEQGVGFPDVRRRTPEAAEHGESQGFKEESMLQGKSGPTAAQPIKSADLLELLQTVIDDPEKWLSTPSVQFGGRKPRDLVGTAEEPKIFDLLHAVDQGLF